MCGYADGECAAGFLARYLSGGTTTPLPSGITLELLQSLQPANLVRREADIALRHQPPESGDYYTAKLGTFAVAVYRRRGAETDAWVAYSEEQSQGAMGTWRTRARTLGSSGRWTRWECRWHCAPPHC